MPADFPGKTMLELLPSIWNFLVPDPTWISLSLWGTGLFLARWDVVAVCAWLRPAQIKKPAFWKVPTAAVIITSTSWLATNHLWLFVVLICLLVIVSIGFFIYVWLGSVGAVSDPVYRLICQGAVIVFVGFFVVGVIAAFFVWAAIFLTVIVGTGLY